MKFRAALFLFISVLVAVPAFAHHGAAAFDMGTTLTLKGTVSEFRFINPHVLISINTKGENGQMQTWTGELTSPNNLTRAGWSTKTLQVGQQLTMIGSPSKSGAHSLWIRKLLGPTGEEMSLAIGN
jgi:hypothetical protein